MENDANDISHTRNPRYVIYKILNEMGPKSLTNLFLHKCEK